MRLKISDSVYQSYVPNQEIADAIKKRLGELLCTERPAEMLAQMVQRRLRDFPNYPYPYSSAEDQAVQSIVLKYQDHALDRLWLLYNVGYFEHDTVRFLELYPWASMESLANDVNIVFNEFCQKKLK